MTPRASGRVRAKKGLGQHFLSDHRVAERIVEATQAGPEDLVIEIGPGRGALTVLLVRRPGTVVGIELDRDLCGGLSARFADSPGFHLLNADAMRVDFDALIRRHGVRDAIVVGNLPYNVATPLIFRLLGSPWLRRAVVMVQREVALRIVAVPGSKAYGSLSVAVQVAAAPRRLFDVGREAFRPVPRVESTVLEIDARRPAFPVAEDIKGTFVEVVRWTFGRRRKMLRATLRSLPGYPLGSSQVDAVAEGCGLDLRRRPETLSIAEFERLALAIRQVGKTATRPGEMPPPPPSPPDEEGGGFSLLPAPGRGQG